MVYRLKSAPCFEPSLACPANRLLQRKPPPIPLPFRDNQRRRNRRLRTRQHHRIYHARPALLLRYRDQSLLDLVPPHLAQAPPAIFSRGFPEIARSEARLNHVRYRLIQEKHFINSYSPAMGEFDPEAADWYVWITRQ